MTTAGPFLPIDAVLPDIMAALLLKPNAVVVAPPGAHPPGSTVHGYPGHTTVYTQPGQVVMVQPAPPAPLDAGIAWGPR